MPSDVDVTVLEERLRAANPVETAAIASVAVAAAQRALRDEVLRTPADPHTGGARATRRRRLRPRLALSSALASVAALAVLAATGIFSGGSGTAWGAELVHFAEASPLVLLDSPGWKVTYADEGSDSYGEMHFSGPTSGSEAQLRWNAGQLSGWSSDRAASAAVITTAPVLGTTATVYEYTGGHPGAQDITSLWVYDNRVLEFRAGAADIPAFEALLASLRAVDVDTWLSALPASAVTASQRSVVIASMLQGIPLPPGFDASSIVGSGLTSDRYQLGATVAGTVACTWFKLWSQARAAGDSAGVSRAIAALASAKDWPVLEQMASSGAYGDVLEGYAAAMTKGTWAGRPLEGDVNSGLGCPALGVPLAVPGGDAMPLAPANAASRP